MAEELPPLTPIEEVPLPEPTEPVEDLGAKIRAFQIKQLQRSAMEQRTNVVQRTMRYLDDAVRSVASGVTLGGADELAAFLNSITSNRDYNETLAYERARDKSIPMAIGLPGEIVGGIATGALTAGVINPTTTGAFNVAKFAALGATEGAVAGFLHGENDIVERAGMAAVGAGTGAAVGAAAPAVSNLVVRGLRAVLDSAKSTAAQREAALQIGRQLQRDELTPEQAMEKLRKLGPEAMVADLGGNVTGMARASATVLGPGRNIAEEALTARAVSAPDRARAAIMAASSDKSATIVRNALIANRARTVTPLYEEAFNAGRITSFKINELIEKSADVKAALAQARRLPEFSELPDNHIILLDKAYKNIGGKVSAAARSGDKELVRDLNRLRLELREAIIEKVPVYGKALDKYSSESDLIDAHDLGRNFIKTDGEILSDSVKSMGEAEREQFTIGVARALTQRLDNASDTSAVVRRIFGSKELRDRIRLAFPTEEAFNQFEREMNREAVFAKTKATVLGGSPTMNKEREVADLLGEAGFASRMDAAGILFSLARQLRSRKEPMMKEMAEMLFNPKRTDDAMLEVTKQSLQRRLARRISGGTVGGTLGGGLPALRDEGAR